MLFRSSDMVEIVGDIPNDWRTEYINTTPSVKDPDGGFDRTEDSTYIISVTVSPKENGAASAGTPAEPVTKTAEAKVNVFIPTVTFGDMRTYLTVAADVANHTPTSVVWMHDGQTTETVKMEGTAPALTYTIVGRVESLYPDSEFRYTRDYYGRVTRVQNGTVEIPLDKVTFAHEPCEDIHTSVGFDSSNGQFLVHVFKPEVTFTDVNKYKGELVNAASDYANAQTRVRWIYANSGGHESIVEWNDEWFTAHGKEQPKAPALTYT